MPLDGSPFRWSFSQWEAYNQCPAKWNYASIQKLPRKPPGPAAARGLEMHNRVESYIKGEISWEECQFGKTHLRFGAKKPAVVSEKYRTVLDDFRTHSNGDRHTELKLNFDEDWCQAGLITKPKWVTAVFDAARVANGTVEIAEWKSGSPKETHVNQRELYALAGLRRWLGVEQVKVTTVYLEDTAPPQRLTVKSTAEDKLRTIWLERAETMRNDNICAPRPGDYCRYMCDFAANKGGPCVYGA
jgi:hypothetical protein